MTWYSTRDRETIIKILQLGISRKIDVKVQIKGHGETFNTKMIHMDTFSRDAEGDSDSEGQHKLIVEKLTPEKGNGLVQRSHEVALEFSVGTRLLKFNTRYSGISSIHPYFGLILGLPESLSITEVRREERFRPKTPEFVYVEFALPKADQKTPLYKLNVLNYSRHGLGLLVQQENLDLVHMLKAGDRIKDMVFYATWAIIKVDVTVRHVTRITEGGHKGAYVMGVQSDEILMDGPGEEG
jgi:hypothetical protein